MWAVVPCKKLSLAKRRLGACLSAPECRQLVSCMLADVLDALTRSAGVSGILVVSNDPVVINRAREFGVQSLASRADKGLPEALTEAGKTLAAKHADGLLVIPGDVPLIRPEDILQVMQAADAPRAVVLVSDRHGSGTNLLATKPVGAIPFLFGENSLQRHAAAALASGIEPAIIRSDTLALDIDTRGDLIAFARAPSPTRTYDFLLDSGIHDRMLESSEDGMLGVSGGRG